MPWTTLRDLAGLGSRLPDIDFDHLIERANQQRADRPQRGTGFFGRKVTGADLNYRATGRFLPLAPN